MSERLQKVLARAGFGSRRALEDAISAGRIAVNGETAILGQKVTAVDQVEFDGRSLDVSALFAESRLVLAYHKPEGEVSTRSDPDGRPTIFDRLPKLASGRWIAVGRLDINTSGLMLLTTDGELANRLMHPSNEVDREYLVRVHGDVQDHHLQTLVDGVVLDDGSARFTDIVVHPEDDPERSNRWFYVALMEGRNREVRRLWESLGFQVNRLKRVRYGCIFLPSFLKQGHFVELGQKEVDDLAKLVELPSIPVPKMTPQQLKDVRRRLSKKGSGRVNEPGQARAKSPKPPSRRAR
jgi:23S rRNA pseudouridine2605 synthase